MKSRHPVFLFVLGALLITGIPGCANRPEVRASAEVIEEVDPSMTPSPTPAPQWVSGVDRIYRVGDTWVARREGDPTPVMLPAATRRLLTSDLSTGAISLQPAPLTQELAAELIRLRELASRNADAMDQMNSSTQQLSKAAQEMLDRNKELMRALEQSRAAAKRAAAAEIKE